MHNTSTIPSNCFLENVPTHQQLLKLVHTLLDQTAYESTADLVEDLKCACAKAGFVYGRPPADVRALSKAIDAAFVVRKIRMNGRSA